MALGTEARAFGLCEFSGCFLFGHRTLPKISDPPASASRALGSQLCTITGEFTFMRRQASQKCPPGRQGASKLLIGPLLHQPTGLCIGRQGHTQGPGDIARETRPGCVAFVQSPGEPLRNCPGSSGWRWGAGNLAGCTGGLPCGPPLCHTWPLVHQSCVAAGL